MWFVIVWFAMGLGSKDRPLAFIQQLGSSAFLQCHQCVELGGVMVPKGLVKET